MNIKIERLNYNDIDKFTDLIRLFEDIFDMKNFKMPDGIFLRQLLKKDDFFVFVAVYDNKIVGGLTSYIIHQYYSKSPLVYIYDLAIKAEFQRQGIGKMLIAGNNAYCKEIGAEAAIDFYQSTGATGQKVIHFDYVL